MTDETTNFDPYATHERAGDSSPRQSQETRPQHRPDTKTGSSGLTVRCPHCHAPMEVAVDTALTDLTCSACGSHFSLVDQSKATALAPSLTKLGRFELIERLGVGSFGSVWKARDKDLDRTVAIKVPRQAAMTTEEQKRVFREARAAAQVRHPKIVAVHEVGRDGDSLYIVSDFVRGVTLDDWLTGQQLTNREAAQLCVKIADALHHAHEQGVVHRDLKPANIIIDVNGEPHITDFGLAFREVDKATLMTIEGQILGTPAYMSPEQAEGKAHTADRRSDVYSLGVILFQLLTGELPFRGNARMLLHQVIHDEPPSPRKLNSSVAKDSETITLKCLQKQPSLRYQTAKELSKDLHHHLAREPIDARPTGRLERAWRWSRRRPAASALLATLVIAAAGFAAAFVRERELHRELVIQKNEAERQRIDADRQRKTAQSERDNANAVVTFLTDDVLAKASPEETTNKAVRDTLVETIIEPSAAIVGERFQDRPLSEVAVRHTLAKVLLYLGRTDLASTNAKRALDLRRKELGESHLDTIESLNLYVATLITLGRAAEAETLVKQALDQRLKVFGDDHEVTLAAFGQYGRALTAQRKLHEAESTLKKALDRSCAVLGDDHSLTIRLRFDHADALSLLGRTREAEPAFKQALESNRTSLGEDSIHTINSLHNYAVFLVRAGRFQEAEHFHKQAYELRRKLLGDSHPMTIRSMNALIETYRDLERFKDANQLQEQALLQGFFTVGMRSVQENDELLDRVIDVAVDYAGEQTPQPLDALVLGELRLVAGKLDSAEAAMRAALLKGGSAPYYHKSLGWCLLAQGRVEAARQSFEEALKDRRREDGSFDLRTTDPDQLTAAFFLDLIPEQEYINRLTADKSIGAFPWFYVGQRREIEGNKAAAIDAYKHCSKLETAWDLGSASALGRWRLEKLTKELD